ncbi:hypothetical protein A5699_05705 [Mycobacterium sp. E802]|uniref:hypothetical protein n=1 Tax=Mycobacterium sp. E802 TaxID=1834152 RepID=UPI0008014548|nr:hypothetical protein [Mycobacterium sp. E802]OBG82646.1 hypothetical protein A5699_05705 [Mycobacterium sp. E802]
MTVYMIVEDDPTKGTAYRAFERHYRSDDVEFRIMHSPKVALETLADTRERSEFDGVIADFGLGGCRQDNWHKRIEIDGPDGTPYTVSTGLGVLDWVHTVDPELHLWALTSDNAAHAPLFMSAAALWLNAKPLSLTRLTTPGSALGDRTRDEFLEPNRFTQLNPSWRRMDNASAALAALLNRELTAVESFDWIHALSSLKGLHRGLIPALNERIQSITRNSKLKAFSNTLAPAMATWQIHLDEIYEGFPDMRQKTRWQQFDPDRLPGALSAWGEFNPFTDFLADHTETREFFAAEDVRIALMKWRGRGQRP